jgi:hypothetical protein
MSYLLQTDTNPGEAIWSDAGQVYFRNGSATSTIDLAAGASTEISIAVGSAALGEPVIVGWYPIDPLPVDCRLVITGRAITNNVILTIANVGTAATGAGYQIGFNVRSVRLTP